MHIIYSKDRKTFRVTFRRLKALDAESKGHEVCFDQTTADLRKLGFTDSGIETLARKMR